MVLMDKYNISPGPSHEMFLSAVHRYLIWASLSALLLAILLSFLLIKRVLEPLSQMIEITRSISSGTYSASVPVKSSDEVGQLAVAFNRMADSLNKIEHLRKTMVINVAHEFRTPLTLILGPLQQLISKVNNPSDKQALSMVLKNAQRLKDLVSQLLSLSKLESGKMKLQCNETNIIEFARTFVQSFESLAKHETIDLVFISKEKEIFAFLDKEKLAQVLNNLLSNAFKFTEEGGRIEISITTLENGKVVNISISDTGQGIPPEKLEHIFDRFYQADDSISREKEGTGIGLAIVKEMVNLHHGKIEAKSTIGKGTTFSIFLPLGSNHLKPDELKASKDSEIEFEHTTFIQRKAGGIDLIDSDLGHENDTDSPPSLLIVEDNIDMRTFIIGFFNEDFKIIEAGDGQDGLKMAVDQIPDIIISDVMMPRMDGYEFCQKIKTDERTSHIPVILLTYTFFLLSL